MARDAEGGVEHHLADEHKVNSAPVGITLVMSTVLGLAGGCYLTGGLAPPPGWR